MSAIAARIATPNDTAEGLSLSAFVADDVTRLTLTRLVAERRWRDASAELGGIEATHRHFEKGAACDLLIVDLSDSADPLGAINGLADVCEPGTRVIALGTANDVKLFRTLIEAGVADYLVKPVSADDLARAIYQANGAKAGEVKGGQGQVIAVIGARGDIGQPHADRPSWADDA